MWGPLAGIKLEMNQNKCLFAEYQYQLYDGGVGSIVDDAHALLVGIACRF